MAAAFEALADALVALAGVVSSLGPDDYATPLPTGTSGSVGAHVRHCLDHVAALEKGLAAGFIDYDDRVRKTLVERDRATGLTALAAARRRLLACDDARLADPVLVNVQLTRGAAPRLVVSTVGRELTFVISHTIHHSATIAVLLTARGRDLPAFFGVAPTTPLALEDRACVRSA
jgi:uncharacterized damage-inducible protein DinB